MLSLALVFITLYAGKTTGTVFKVKASLNVRESPSASATILKTLPPGADVDVLCQTTGDKITGGANIWDKLSTGGYVHDAYVKTGYSGFSPNIPRCEDDSAIVPSNEASSKGEEIVAKAKTQLGLPYSWGGGNFYGPSYGFCCSPSGKYDGTKVWGFDCSGLALYAVYQATGKKLPHNSDSQAAYEGCQKIDLENRAAGDLVFYKGHVTIYAGDGQMVEATPLKSVVSKFREEGAFSHVRRCW